MPSCLSGNSCLLSEDQNRQLVDQMVVWRHLDGIVTLVDAKHLIMHLDEAHRGQLA